MKIATALTLLRTGQVKFLLPNYFYSMIRASQVGRTATVTAAPVGTPGVLEIHMLTGRSHIYDLLFAAKTFLCHLGRPASLVVHGDAGLGQRESEVISHHIRNARIILAEESDPIVENFLIKNGWSRALSFRRNLPLARKLFDFPLFASADRIVILDTDTIAFRPLDELAAYADHHPAVNVFGRDPYEQPYVEFDFGFQLVRSINSGIGVVKKDLFDFAKIEEWLIAGLPMLNHFSEQTVFAALASIQEARYLSADYCVGMPVQINPVFVHYCGHRLSHARINMRQIGQRTALKTLLSAGQF